MGTNRAGICVFKTSRDGERLNLKSAKELLLKTPFSNDNKFSLPFVIQRIKQQYAFMQFFGGKDFVEINDETEFNKTELALSECKKYLAEEYGVTLKEKSVFQTKNSPDFICISSDLFGFESIEEYTENVSKCFTNNKVFSYALFDGEKLLFLIAENGEFKFKKVLNEHDYPLAFKKIEQEFGLNSEVVEFTDDPIDFLSKIEKLISIKIF